MLIGLKDVTGKPRKEIRVEILSNRVIARVEVTLEPMNSPNHGIVFLLVPFILRIRRLLHQAFFGEKMGFRILSECGNNLVDFAVLHPSGQTEAQFLHQMKELLVLLIEQAHFNVELIRPDHANLLGAYLRQVSANTSGFEKHGVLLVCAEKVDVKPLLQDIHHIIHRRTLTFLDSLLEVLHHFHERLML
jgi:hypothetical protein